ncbi:MAG: hypothetical protein Q9227_007934 [Pyrenula ochraceoflavens]
MQAFAAILGLLTVSANGHMIMKTPVPYDKDQLDNSPLENGGSNFPCKTTGFQVSTENQMPIGAPQTLSFTGSAVHGGGSCQVSLTKDRKPTKDSKWQVIHSIEGGCPANTAGNLPEDPSGSGASTFQFSIPQGIAPGQYSLAWTWFNKIGNREMYMNCAPVTVTGGSSKRDMMSAPISKKRDTSFPAMFVANIFPGCTVPESTDLQFPDPGASVDKVVQTLAPPPSGCGKYGIGPSGPISGDSSSGSSSSGSDSGSSSSGNSSSAAAPAASGSSSSDPSASSSSSGGFATGAAGGSSAGGSSPSTATAQPSASVVSPAAPSSSGTSSGGSTSGGAMSGPCSTEGAWSCSADGTSFQRCASGAWSAAQPVAAGTKCTPGQAQDIKIIATGAGAAAGGAQRRAAHVAGHVRRSHHAWGLSS